MPAYRIPLQLPDNNDSSSRIIPLLDEDFDPFESESLDVADDEVENMYEF